MEKERKPHGKNPPPKREICIIKKMREKKTLEEEKIPSKRKRRENSRDSPFCNIPHPQEILKMSILDLSEGFGEDIDDLLYYRTIL